MTLKTNIFTFRVEPDTLRALRELSPGTTTDFVRDILRKHFVSLLKNDGDYPCIVQPGISADDAIQLHLKHSKAKAGIGGYSFRAISGRNKKKLFCVVKN